MDSLELQMQLQGIHLERELISSHFPLNDCQRDELSKAESDSYQKSTDWTPTRLVRYYQANWEHNEKWPRSPGDAASDTSAKTGACGR